MKGKTTVMGFLFMSSLLITCGTIWAFRIAEDSIWAIHTSIAFSVVIVFWFRLWLMCRRKGKGLIESLIKVYNTKKDL